MGTYVVSDIHGCYTVFMNLLKKINFSDGDKLIVAGDYIDRGKENQEMLEWILHSPDNIIKICGNHDKEFEQLLNRNNVPSKQLRRYADAISQMPYLYKCQVNGRLYIVVHAGYISKEEFESAEFKEKYSTEYSSIEEFYLYAREEAILVNDVKGVTVIAGHTPTIAKGKFAFNNGKVFRYYNKEKDFTFYDIDCGCSYQVNGTRGYLAAIRLEDEKIFYI